MGIHVASAIEKLKVNLLELSTLVEQQVQHALRSLYDLDVELSRDVIRRDKEVDQREIDIEEQCLQILALYQPVALDLRFVVAALKMNNDLERIGDLAKNIASRSIELSENKPPQMPINFAEMAEKTTAMLRQSLKSLISIDADMAQLVCDSDLEVDDLHSDNYKLVEKSILKYPDASLHFIRLLSISRYLERIADLATNIAEDVIYLANGTIVRHS